MLSLLVLMKDRYEVLSNRGSGYGRCIIELYAKDKRFGVVFEFLKDW